MSVVATWSTAVSYEIEVQSGGVVRFAAGNNIPIDLRSSGAGLITANAWYHVAAARASGVTRLFINGANVAAHSGSVSISQAATNMRIAGFPGGSNRWTGYVSDLRIVKGQAAYTANFTPATSSLSTTSQSITSANVFLGCNTNRFIDANTTPKTISSFTSTPKVQAFSPIRPSASYTPATHGGSVYLDGSGDYVYITNNAVMTLGTKNHCIEFWMYPDGSQAVYACPWCYNGSIIYYFSIGSYGGGDVSLLLGGGSPWSLQITTGNTEYLKILNNWTHVAITRSGTAFRMFFNGRLVGYGTASQSISAQTSAFSIGWDGVNATTYYKGWMSNFRVINGSIPAAYQTSSTTTGTTIFTPPTSVPAFEANTAMAMNFTNGGIVDATGRHNFETVGDAKIANVQSKFGLGSLYFDGTGDYLYAPTSTSLLYPGGLGDITIEAWVYTTSTADQTIMYLNGGTGGYAAIRVGLVSSGAYLLVSSSGSGWAINTGTVGSAPINQWHHIAVVRNGGTFTLYVNGSSAASSSAVSATTALMAGTQHVIGAHQNSTYQIYFVGYIDDLRITRFARYTGASLTVPTGPFLTK